MAFIDQRNRLAVPTSGDAPSDCDVPRLEVLDVSIFSSAKYLMW